MCAFVCVCVYVSVCACVCAHLCLCVRLRLCLRLCLCLCSCLCVNMHGRVCVCVCTNASACEFRMRAGAEFGQRQASSWRHSSGWRNSKNFLCHGYVWCKSKSARVRMRYCESGFVYACVLFVCANVCLCAGNCVCLWIHACTHEYMFINKKTVRCFLCHRQIEVESATESVRFTLTT